MRAGGTSRPRPLSVRTFSEERVVDPVGQLILEQKWQDHTIRRRLAVWKERARGVTAEQLAPLWGVSVRTIYYDFAELRELMVRAAAPEIEEIRCQVDAPLQEVYREALETHRAAREGDGISRGMLSTARQAATDRARLHGAIDDRSRVEVHVPTSSPAQLLATKSTDELREIAGTELEAIAELAGNMKGSGNGSGNGAG